jgi:ubiquinol-cytochrome c reductase cytochrome c subunit
MGRWLIAIGLIGLALSLTSGSGVASSQEANARGPDLYQQQCASCHGGDGAGTFRGPSLVGAGAASADYYLRSGLMPLSAPHVDPQRRPAPVYTDEQIRRLVAYVASLGDGPAIPKVDVDGADLAAGGELFQVNCAQCHSWDARGGALVAGDNAPALHHVPVLQIAEAIRVGPGAMPAFGEDALSERDLQDVVAYVRYLQEPLDRGGWGLAHWGPSAEALAGFVALGALLLITGALGKRTGSW